MWTFRTQKLLLKFPIIKEESLFGNQVTCRKFDIPELRIETTIKFKVYINDPCFVQQERWYILYSGSSCDDNP